MFGSFAVDRRDADDVEREKTVEVAVFVRHVVGDGEIDDADGVEGDERDEDVGEGGEDAGEFALGADRFPGAQHQAEAVASEDGGSDWKMVSGIGFGMQLSKSCEYCELSNVRLRIYCEFQLT